MLRTTFTGLALALAALACQPAEAIAAGRAPAIAARPAGSFQHGVQPRAFGPRIGAERARHRGGEPHGRGRYDQHADGHDRYGRSHRRHAGWPLPYGYDPGFAGPTAVYEVEAEPPKPVDPFAFANLPARAGIPYPPTPEPTIYRLEGRRDRPVTRIIRVSEAQAGSQRTRHVHAETGALLLTVPGR